MTALPKIAFPWAAPADDEAEGWRPSADSPLPSPQRGEGGPQGRMRGQEAAICWTCAGAGVVFRCPEWQATQGECCPAGAHRIGCPGQSLACGHCLGAGRV